MRSGKIHANLGENSEEYFYDLNDSHHRLVTSCKGITTAAEKYESSKLMSAIEGRWTCVLQRIHQERDIII